MTLQEQRMKLVHDQREIISAADKESRGLTADELERFDRIDGEIVTLKATIDRADKVEAEERAERIASVETTVRPDNGGFETRTPATMAASVPTETRTGTASDEYRSAFDARMRGQAHERRALEVGTSSEGGYLVPDQWAAQLVQARNEVNIMRGLATVITTTSGTFNLPTVSSHGTASWTAEEASYSESDEAFGVVQFSAYKAATLVKVSEELLRDSQFDLSSYLTTEFARRIGRLEEAAFIDGDASSKPKGTIYDAGVSVTAAGATAVTSLELVSLYHGLGREYRDNASWLMHDNTVQLVRKLVDGNSQFIWQPGMQAGQPDTLLGRPVYTSSAVPVPTSAKKAIVFGDLSYYWIADRQGISVQRLDELYAASGQVGFRASSATDGANTVTAAVKVLQMA